MLEVRSPNSAGKKFNVFSAFVLNVFLRIEKSFWQLCAFSPGIEKLRMDGKFVLFSQLTAITNSQNSLIILSLSEKND